MIGGLAFFGLVLLSYLAMLLALTLVGALLLRTRRRAGTLLTASGLLGLFGTLGLGGAWLVGMMLFGIAGWVLVSLVPALMQLAHLATLVAASRALARPPDEPLQGVG